MYYVEALQAFYPIWNYNEGSGGGILMPDGSTRDAIKPLGHTINFIYSWLQSFEETFS